MCRTLLNIDYTAQMLIDVHFAFSCTVFDSLEQIIDLWVLYFQCGFIQNIFTVIILILQNQINLHMFSHYEYILNLVGMDIYKNSWQLQLVQQLVGGLCIKAPKFLTPFFERGYSKVSKKFGKSRSCMAIFKKIQDGSKDSRQILNWT